MRAANIAWLIASLLFSIGTLGFAYDTSFQVLEPLEESIHTQDQISCVVRVDTKKLDTIKITTDKNERFTITITPERDTYCQSVPIHHGKNKIKLRLYSEGKKMGEQSIELYRSAPLSKTEKFPPRGYTRKFFHTTTEEMLCKRCHDMSVNEEEGVAFLEVEESNCYLCHKTITQKHETHAPAVNWLCTSCHSGKAAEHNSKDEGKSRFLAPDPIGQVCLDCHKKTNDLWKSKEYQHDPASMGRCTRCHDPHASRNRYTLRKPTWDLCRTCHRAKATKEAFLQELSKQPDHPFNPANSEHELFCTTCHNPHVSDAGYFLQPNYPGDMKICRELNTR